MPDDNNDNSFFSKLRRLYQHLHRWWKYIRAVSAACVAIAGCYAFFANPSPLRDFLIGIIQPAINISVGTFHSIRRDSTYYYSLANTASHKVPIPFAEAEQYLKRSLELDKTNSDSYVLLASLYVIKGDTSQAISVLQQSKEFSSNYLDRQLSIDIIKLFSLFKSVTLDASFRTSPAFNDLLSITTRLENDKRIQDITGAIAYIHVIRAHLFYILKDYKNAIDSLKDDSEHNPDNNPLPCLEMSRI